MYKKIINNKNDVSLHKALLLLFSLLLSFYVYLEKPGFAQKLLADIEDVKFSIRNSVIESTKNNNVVVVAIDEPSVNKLGRWPWDRKDIAKILSKLNQASIVGLDIVFSESSNPESDKKLAATIEDNENIILGYFLRSHATEDTDEEVWSLLDEYAYHSFKNPTGDLRLDDWKYVEVNTPGISEAALSGGFFTTKPDTDGIFRHYPLAYLHKGLVLPPLAIQILRYYWDENANLTFGDEGISEFELGAIHVTGANHIRLNFYENINEVSAVDIHSGKIKPEYFKDKIVLVGATEVGIYDLRPIPVDPVAPGVYQHYTAVTNLLNNNFINSNEKIDIALLLVSLITILIVSYAKQYYVRISYYSLLILFVLIFSYVAFITSNTWLHEGYYLFAILLSIILYESEAFIRTESNEKQVKDAFSSYVSKELVGELLADPEKLKLGGDEREITTLFTDVRNFTTISEGLTPTNLVSLLNQMFDPFTKVVLKNKGMLDKYIGDAMMVIFNAPLDVDNHAERACISALEMLHVQKKIQTDLEKNNLPPVTIGIGINTGIAIVGNMGSTVRFGYTAIGDSVNLAARLEGLNKNYATEIIISEATRDELPADSGIVTRKLDKIQVKGKNEPVTIYEIFSAEKANTKLINQFEVALLKYFSADFAEASKMFNSIYESYGDETSLIFRDRCDDYLINSPGENWNGIHRMTSK